MGGILKKHIVDFVSECCRVKGKKIPKSKLNQLSKEQLVKFIEEQPELNKAFMHYMENVKSFEEKVSEEKESSILQCNNQSEVASKELADELECLVEKLAENPNSFIAIMELKHFIHSLPFGSISSEKLTELTVKMTKVAPGMALLLLEYSTNQTLKIQKE